MPEAGVGKVAGEMDGIFLFSVNKLKNKRRAKDLNRFFFQRRHKGPNRYLKRYSMSLMIIVMQIKIIECHFICIRTVVTRNTKNDKC